jgi:hypothetical protein
LGQKRAVAQTDAKSFCFLSDRLFTAPTTEVSKIHTSAALLALRVARDRGSISLKKAWACDGDDPCEDCQQNENDGAIDLDDVFSSGASAPPQHPRCECSIVAVIDTDD